VGVTDTFVCDHYFITLSFQSLRICISTTYDQILNLLGDGNISDLSISSIASEDDLDYLLQQFENDGYSGIIEDEHLTLTSAEIFDESENLSEQGLVFL